MKDMRIGTVLRELGFKDVRNSRGVFQGVKKPGLFGKKLIGRDEMVKYLLDNDVDFDHPDKIGLIKEVKEE